MLYTTLSFRKTHYDVWIDDKAREANEYFKEEGNRRSRSSSNTLEEEELENTKSNTKKNVC